MTGPTANGDEGSTYPAQVGSQALDLPIVPLSDGLAIALLITVDLGVSFAATAGAELAREVAPLAPEVVVSVATMGIPVAMEVTRALGLDDYVILHKTPKIHLADAYTEPVRSITTGTPQTLRLDRARVGAVRGRRVAIVDDVISTGASIHAALALVRRVGGDPVAVGVLVTEGSDWRRLLGDDAERVHALGSLPLFRRLPDGSMAEDWE